LEAAKTKKEIEKLAEERALEEKAAIMQEAKEL
jgi:hypothetical protein